MRTKIVRIASFVVGAAAIVFGILMWSGKMCTVSPITSGNVHTSGQNTGLYEFGGDFYTDIYEVTWLINDNINEYGNTIITNQGKAINELNAIESTLVMTHREETANKGIILCFIGAAFVIFGVAYNGADETKKVAVPVEETVEKKEE